MLLGAVHWEKARDRLGSVEVETSILRSSNPGNVVLRLSWNASQSTRGVGNMGLYNHKAQGRFDKRLYLGNHPRSSKKLARQGGPSCGRAVPERGPARHFPGTSPAQLCPHSYALTA